MPNHAKLLLILCVTAGLWAQPQTAATSTGNERKPAAKELSSAPQTNTSGTAVQASATLPDSTGLEAIYTPDPVYPLGARERELQGQVVIRLVISQSGEVESATIVSGEPILAEAAVDAMRKWKFKPYIKDGKAVRARVPMSFNFAFKGNVTQIKEAAHPPAPHSQGTSATSDAAKTGPVVNQRPVKLRVSQGVMDGIKIYDVSPVYPPEARRRHIQGEVILRATIGTDGLINNLQVISGPAELVQAATGAIQQWRYRPYLLKGEPFEVDTVITVKFHM